MGSSTLSSYTAPESAATRRRPKALWERLQPRLRQGLSRLKPLPQRLALIATLLACVSCGAARTDGPSAEIIGARLSATPDPVLETDLRLRFSRTMLDALDRGIPLVLQFELRGSAPDVHLSERRRIELRYLPLAQQYRMHDLATGSERGFPRRTQLLAALDQVRLPLAPDWRVMATAGTLRVRCTLDASALPAPLRLPALFDRDWRLATPEYAWTAGG
jgi:hypothetical protein